MIWANLSEIPSSYQSRLLLEFAVDDQHAHTFLAIRPIARHTQKGEERTKRGKKDN